jgi:transcriptional regulator with XRE-family HTH domain
MKLKPYLQLKKIKSAEFARIIGRNAQNVARYVSGQRIPDKDTMPLIYHATNGEVTANDFYDLPTHNQPRKK